MAFCPLYKWTNQTGAYFVMLAATFLLEEGKEILKSDYLPITLAVLLIYYGILYSIAAVFVLVLSNLFMFEKVDVDGELTRFLCADMVTSWRHTPSLSEIPFLNPKRLLADASEVPTVVSLSSLSPLSRTLVLLLVLSCLALCTAGYLSYRRSLDSEQEKKESLLRDLKFHIYNAAGYGIVSILAFTVFSLLFYQNVKSEIRLAKQEFKAFTDTIPEGLMNPDPFTAKYKFLNSDRPIGKGSFGVVYAVESVDGNLKGVVKRQKPTASLLQEVQLMKRLEHPNILETFDVYLVHQEVWIVSESLSRGSLADLEKPVDEDKLAYVLQSTLKGLRYLHEEIKVVHRDIKGLNVMISQDGSIKIIDFGTCINIDDAEKPKTLGTLHYMPPEVVLKRRVTAKADMWAVGAMALELLGALPYRERNVKTMEELRMVYKEKVMPTYPSKISDELKSFLDSCFKYNPEKRPSASKLLAHPFLTKACDRQVFLDYKGL